MRKEKTTTDPRRSDGSKRPRLPRLDRAEEAARPRFRLTERDRDVVVAVYDYRVMTTNQIEALFFAARNGGSKSAKSPYNSRCRLRLQALYHAGYLQRDEQPQKLSEGRKPLLYFLDVKGAELVAQTKDVPIEELDWNPKTHQVSPFTIEHLLATNDVRVTIQLSVRTHGLAVTCWVDDSSLRRQGTKDYVLIRTKEGSQQKVAIVPDGYFVLETEKHKYHQFLEVDMGTTTGIYAKTGKRDWARKVSAYLEYHRSGKYGERYGTQSMRVLTVTTSERRLANLRAVTEHVGGKGRFWFTTFAKVSSADALTDPIWNKAGSAEFHSLI
jgi:hypothetical protein